MRQGTLIYGYVAGTMKDQPAAGIGMQRFNNRLRRRVANRGDPQVFNQRRGGRRWVAKMQPESRRAGVTLRDGYLPRV